MIHKIGHITLLVDDFDKALDFYVDKLGFEKIADVQMGHGVRWLTVAPKNATETAIVFVIANTPEKKLILGKQAGNHVLFTVHTDNCVRDFKILRDRGVRFLGEPKDMAYGTEVVMEDLYGNRLDLIQVSVN
jgi:catechol 2,3-dioxygenase-like lactoylglutathione lyase family enzyme